MLETRRNFNPMVEIFNPYSIPFSNKEESNMDDNQQTNYKAVQCKLCACSACYACSACG